MDIVLEILDTVFFDRAYATLLPASSTSFVTQYVKDHVTSTWSSMRETGTSTPTPQHKYIYQPATQFFSLEPSHWAYSGVLPRDNIYRQALSLFLITWVFGILLYFVFSSLSYYFVFDKNTKNHPKYLKNQVWLEIEQAMTSMPGMAILTMLFFTIEVRGYAKLYDHPKDAPFPLYNWLQFPFFLLFTDMCIYGIHRGLHHPLIYKHMHKAHHKWIMPTPYASHAFHPVDGFLQSLPYHIFPLLFPLQKFAYLLLFVFVNVWTILIHDGEYMADSPILNGAACHSLHHEKFLVNYGQYTTLWDRLGGSYRRPTKEMFDKETKMSKDHWIKESKETEQIQQAVEGDDDREYLGDASREQKKTL